MASYDTYRYMLRTALAAGVPVVSTDTAARILSVLYVHGNKEDFVYSPKLRADLEYIKARFGVEGSRKADPNLAALVKSYSQELEHYKSEEPYHGSALFHDDKPLWAIELFFARYGIRLD